MLTHALLVLSAALAADPSYTCKLDMKERALDPEGSKKQGMMYMPSGAKLAPEKPALVKKEPTYRGTPRYITLTIGNGPSNQFAVAFDEPDGQTPKVFMDTNGNGDLTDDGDGSWPIATPGKDGGPAQYSGTWVFQSTWKGPDGKAVKGAYGLNFYRNTERESINFYRASARVGKIKVGDKECEAMLIENDNDGVYNKPVDPNAAMIAGGMGKPIWLKLDGGQFDIRETFGFADMNFEATVSDDGSSLTLTPTMKNKKLPRTAADKAPILGAGKEAPDFDAMLWKDGKEEAFKLSDYKGKILVIDMWATWCGPCRASLPHLSKLAETVKDQGVVVIALNVFDEKAAYDGFVKEQSAKYKFLLARDPAGRENAASLAKRLFNISAIPVTYIIDKQGKIAEAISGYSEGDKFIEAGLKKLGVKID